MTHPWGVFGRKDMYAFMTNESGTTAIEYSIIAITTCVGSIFLLANISSDMNNVINMFILAIG